MNADEIRERARNSPEWLAVEIVKRLEAIEAKIKTLEAKPKRGRPRKVT